MTNLLEHVEESVRERKLLRRGERMLVAVSGGLDSMVLLHLLHSLAARQGWKLIVAHFNHQLRGRASDADERLVCDTAKSLGLQVISERGEVQALADQWRVSIEMAARDLRHQFLARTARSARCRVVALAHHADDQVELFFLRLLRGAGGEGLAGMKWRALSPADAKIHLIRPLLDVSRADLEAFAGENKIRFREDATNASREILRNRIRHELLPLMRRSFQPALNQSLLRVMEIVGAESEAVESMALKWLAQKRPAFARLPVAVQRRVLQLQLRRLKVQEAFDLVESLRLSPGCPVTIRPNVSVERNAAGRVIVRTLARETFPLNSLALELWGNAAPPGRDKAVLDCGGKPSATPLWDLPKAPKSGVAASLCHRSPKSTPSANSLTDADGGEATLDGLQLRWKVIAAAGARFRPQPGGEQFDADQVGRRIILRHWQPGDRFQPIGMTGAVKLQDWFTNRKVPRADRRRLIVATTVAGEVFWIENQRISERFKLSPKTKRRLSWKWRRSAGL